MIRHVTAADFPAIEAIARQYPAELAFVRRVSLERATNARELYVAEVNRQDGGWCVDTPPFCILVLPLC